MFALEQQAHLQQQEREREIQHLLLVRRARAHSFSIPGAYSEKLLSTRWLATLRQATLMVVLRFRIQETTVEEERRF